MAERGREGWYDPRRGAPPLRVDPWTLDAAGEPPRTNYFTIYAVEAGEGLFWADAGRHRFEPGRLLFFAPYQHVRFEPASAVRGSTVKFHANFLCVETFHAESGCSGALFNDPKGEPWVALDPSAAAEAAGLVSRLDAELHGRALAHEEASLALLKLLLILAARRKAAGACAAGEAATATRHPVVQRLRELVEERYRDLHAPADYAALLHMTPKALGRCVREQLGRTPTDLVRARILTHAKWQLLHTLRPVKEIAAEVGFQDELYFSRLFKKAVGCSPKFFRDFETEIRGGSNPSMLSPQAPIPTPPAF